MKPVYLPSTGLYATVSHEKTDKDRSEFAFFIPTDFPVSVGSTLSMPMATRTGRAQLVRPPARPVRRVLHARTPSTRTRTTCLTICAAVWRFGTLHGFQVTDYVMNDMNNEFVRYFSKGGKSKPRFASRLAWKVRGGNYRDGFAQWVSSYSGVVHIPCAPAAFPERRSSSEC